MSVATIEFAKSGDGTALTWTEQGAYLDGIDGPLEYHLPGAWSRRIDDEHRLVYIVAEAEIVILAARYHY